MTGCELDPLTDGPGARLQGAAVRGGGGEGELRRRGENVQKCLDYQLTKCFFYSVSTHRPGGPTPFSVKMTQSDGSDLPPFPRQPPLQTLCINNYKL